MELLAKQMSLYTLGESSSLPDYDAYRLLASICFVLRIDPADPDSADIHIAADDDVQEVFNRNLLRLEAKTLQLDALWKEVCLSAPLLESVALRDTLEGLCDFADRYDPRFFAHETPSDIDYQLCFPVSESLQGIDYVAAYLQQLLIECRFLQLFDVRDCRRILTSYSKDYGELIINLFEPIASNALGCALVKRDVHTLNFGDEGFRCLCDLLGAEGNDHCLEGILQTAVDGVCRQMAINDLPTRRYLNRLARSLSPRIRIALRQGGVAGIFGLYLSDDDVFGQKKDR